MEHQIDVAWRFVIDERLLFDFAPSQLIDLRGHVATVLTPIAVRVLALFAQAPFAIYPRRQLLNDGWCTFGFEVCGNSLNQVISTLRATFDALDPARSYIKTLPLLLHGRRAGRHARGMANQHHQALEFRACQHRH